MRRQIPRDGRNCGQKKNYTEDNCGIPTHVVSGTKAAVARSFARSWR